MHRFFLYPIILNLFLPLTYEVNAFPFFGDKCEQYKYSSSKLFKNKVNSVVVVTTPDAQGSGFVVKQDKEHTYILTNAHVIGSNKIVDIEWSNQENIKGKVIGNLGGDELSNDLALIEVEGKRGVPQVFLRKPPEIGSDAVVIGSPSGLEFSLTRGVVSQVRENNNFIQIDAPVNPGNSGGPVFNHAGCVIGIVTFKISDNSEGLNFAISHKLIKKFLENPVIDQKAIDRAMSSKFQSNSNYIELWNGIYTGMNENQVRNALGGKVRCIDDWDYEEGENDYWRLNVCYRMQPLINLVEEKVRPVVFFEQKANQRYPLGTVKKVHLVMENSNFQCKLDDPSRCEYYANIHQNKSLRLMREKLDQKYGNGLFNRDRDTLIYYGKNIKIQLINYSIGRWGILYTEDDSNL